MSQAPAIDQERVLVLAPTPADAALSRTIILDAGLACHVEADSDSLARSVSAGVGAILLTEEVVTRWDNRELARVETIKAFRLIEQLLTAEDEELTPTMKLKRTFVNVKYKDLIDGMYERSHG